MKRLPDSPSRAAHRLRFPILMFVGMDLALAALVLVFALTPLHPIYPPNPVGTGIPQPQVASVVLPAPLQKVTSAPVTHSQAPRVPQPAPTTHRPSPSRTAVSTPSKPVPSPTVTATAKPPSSPAPTPTDTESPSP